MLLYTEHKKFSVYYLLIFVLLNDLDVNQEKQKILFSDIKRNIKTNDCQQIGTVS